MSKHLIELSSSDSDAIITTDFYPEMKDDKPVVSETDKSLFKGKHKIHSVCFIVPFYDNNGNPTWHKVYLKTADIVNISKKIKDIESKDVEDKIPDDLPF